MNEPRLKIRLLDKAWSVPVLKQLNLTLAPGEIHGLVGENGAGKSTLVNILAGLVAKDGGKIYLDGESYSPTRPSNATEAGVSCTMQELTTIDTLSVAENIFIRSLPNRRFVVDSSRLHSDARRLLDLVGLEHLSVECLAGTLSLAEKQLLEFARALAIETRLLILDEPTAALATHQAERMHDIINRVASENTSVLYISHRLDDVIDVCDRVTVLRDGRVVASSATDTLHSADLVRQMSGDTGAITRPNNVSGARTNPVVKLKDVTTRDLPHPVSLELQPGEALGVAGLAGAGRSELLGAMFGLVPLLTGSIGVMANDVSTNIRSATQAVRLGVAYLGEDRKTMGLFAGQSVLTNIMIPGAKKPFSTVNHSAESAAGAALQEKLNIRCSHLGQDIDQLSGGNQQKALLARWLHCDSKILLLDEPTRGVDVATKMSIYALLQELQESGKSIVICSSEIDELLNTCDRIVVLSNRKLVANREAGEWTEAEILAAAFQEHSGRGGTAVNRTQI